MREPLQAAAVALALAALAQLAQPAAAKFSSTNYCIWSGLLYTPFQPTDDFYNVAITLPKSCDDPLIASPTLRAQCKACQQPTSRAACLARTAQEWHGGTDVESCTWVSRNALGQTTRELNFTLGTNEPYMFASPVDQSVCETVRDYEVTSPPSAYSAVYFQSYGNGAINGKLPIPSGWRPETSCVVKSPGTRCRLRFWTTPDIQWAISQRDIYTTNEGVIGPITKPGNFEECILKEGSPAQRCLGANPPFKYRVLLTSIPCAKGQKPSPEVRYEGEFPLAQPGWLLYPRRTVNPYREKAFFLEGLSEFHWQLEAVERRQVLSLIAPAHVLLSVCPPPRYEDTVCAYTNSLDTPGYLPSVCYNNKCWGSFRPRAGRNDIFMVTYPLWQASSSINQEETPTQTIRISLRGKK